ncbi:MAG: acyl-CoA/acyl-ACP dehydrogenase [Actinobacteria bacterium]|nr:acyl-CoA/acyl-ACP dehydrogenase [Actinomycetota bacterium]MBV8958040.1 acyl-CoA/acyl-ACP dehydrogenase [Actinomycetota bacterium]MBV9254122.1 acyl-CoA/acyl-ACP dehydrogenase [Actinomycetota bacterium]MBV9666444.1 acyl-CoA/acyl-ACP dehydrogenase [Actinomycetota bacterium]MBV9936008.1 acyl-CoA/acyl-ACP dehydrogenase [Actinomycetota bacterium]
MEFALSDEQQELRRTVRAFLEQKSPETEVRRLMETDEGYDPAVWAQMSSQLGLQGLVIPEELGGSGYTMRELGIVLEEMGRVLLCAPFFSTAVLATSALLASGDDAVQKALLPKIASGESIATLALLEERGGWDEDAVQLTATEAGGSWTLSGVKSFVLDGHTADTILVAARTPAGVSLFHVAGDAAGLTRGLLVTMDQTRKLARLEFADTPAQLIGTEGGGWPAVDHALQMAAVALANEQVGGAQRCMEISVDYAQNRIQFGRPIGSFQAVKHRCADMLVQVEMAKSAAYYANWCAATESDDLAVAAPMAKSYCSEAYFRIASDTIQVHGGIGFTWEHPAHLYFKRAKSAELLFGDPRHQRKLLARQLGF